MNRSHPLRASGEQTAHSRPLALALALALTWPALAVGCKDDAPAAPPTQPPTERPAPPTVDTVGPGVDFAPEPTRADIDALLTRDRSDAFYGVYIQGNKVGHGRITLRASAPGEPGGVASRMELDMVLAGAGARQTMNVAEVRYYGGEAPFPLVASSYRLEASGTVDERSLTADPDAVVVKRKVNGEAQPDKRLPPTKDTLRSALVTAPLHPARVPRGATASAHTWSWDRLRDDVVSATAQGVERVRRAGVTSDVLTLDLAYELLGVRAITRVADDGAVLEMSVGGAMVLRLEEEAVARSGVTGFDILSTGVSVDARLGPPERVDALKLRARLPEGATLPDAPNQRVAAASDRWVTVSLARGAGAPVREGERDAALAADAVVDADHPTIQQQSASLTAGLQTDREKVDALSAWVYKSVEKRLATHMPTASSVLRSRFGDCSEHAWLMAALTRAAGIPARPVYGVAWLGDRERAFGYHAWVEVALDGRWWPVDPTWNQPMVDATHLKLGEDLGAVGRALGALELEVVEE